MSSFVYVRHTYEPGDEPLHVLDDEELGEDAEAGDTFVVMFDELHALQLLPPDPEEAAEDGVEAPWWDGLILETGDDQVRLTIGQRDDTNLHVITLRPGPSGVVAESSQKKRPVEE